jgi:hypothetical protein
LPNRRIARSTTACVASVVSGVFSDGFHTTGSPPVAADGDKDDHHILQD